MTTQEAIGVLKKNILEHLFSTSTLEEAIYTVVAELEKPTYTAEDMEEFEEWVTENGWFYRSFFKVWEKRGCENKTTAQLREMWEQSRKEATV